jgi:ketosteroid isomerase-like protein
MNEREGATPLNFPQPDTSVEAERTLPPPNFDENSIHRARPAVPLTHPPSRASEGRGRSLTLVALAVAAGMLGGIVGIFAINAYQKRAAATTPAQTASATQVGGQSTTAPISTAAPVSTAANSSPAVSEDKGARAKETTTSGAQPTADGNSGGVQAANADAGETTQQRVADEAEARALRAALGEWIAATNARDIDRQMNFYEPRVSAFYLTRNVSREAVRAEKTNVFARASAVDVRADEPQISLSPDGRVATMRFRKEYAIEGGGQERRGAVIQELRWRRTPAGWKITSERDLRVVN